MVNSECKKFYFLSLIEVFNLSTKFLFQLFGIILFLFPITIFAQWPALSTPNVQVTNSVSTTGKLNDYWASTDGAGGSFTFFTDDRLDVSNGNESIYCQRFNRNGIVKFTANGVSISTIAAADQDRPNSTEDGFGNAIVIWEDDRGGDDDIYAQKIDSSGVVQWTTNGVVVCDAIGDQKRAWVVPDDSGGVIIAWEDNRGINTNIYAQRIDSDSNVKWTLNGVVISSAIGDQKRPHMVEDGAGGAIITWEDKRSGVDIYAQRVDAFGAVQWTANGVLISNAINDQDRPKVTTDEFNGGIISWTDQRSGTEDIYAQRIDSAGVVQWTANGVAICTSTNKQDRTEITNDQNNGAVIVWEDKRTGTEDIYAQRVNSSGVVQWTANGVAVSTATDVQKRPNVSPGSYGKTLIVWEDARTAGTEDIYIQILTLNGDTLVTADGLAVCTATDVQKKPFIFRNADTDWIVTWEDDRNTATGKRDLYAQGINPTIIPVLPIELLSFDAIVEGDQVVLNWKTASEINNDFFTIEKSTNLIDYDPAFNVDGNGNSNEILEYTAIDDKPFRGISYYRLKQTDYNGKFSYSDPVAVELQNLNNQSVDIYPNPLNGGDNLNLKFKYPNSQEILVHILDVKGNEVDIIPLSFSSKSPVVSLPIGNLPKGTYMIKIENADFQTVQKLIIE